MNRLLIRNGIIVTPDEIFRADIFIVDETIAQIAPSIEAAGARVIDATGLHILPGLIDPHVHLRDPGATHKEDFTTGTRAALAGGVTTLLDMPNNPQPTTTRAALEEKRALARAKAVCDYGFFVGATKENERLEIGDWGAVGVKLYMGATTGDLLVTDFASIFRHFRANPLPIVVHAEDNEALRFFANDPSRTRHSAKRPPVAAALAVSRALVLAEETGRRLHIAHLSTAKEIELVKAAKARGARVSCEVTPQHLLLSTDDEERLGALGIVNPPLRSPEDVRALWQNLDHCDLVATDHAPHTLEEKQSAKPSSGMPGLETMLPLLLTAASEKRMALQGIARLTARNPARVFRLARKGEIAVGYDADLTFVRLDDEYVLRKPWQTKCNWSPFEGRRARGRIQRVFLRGREVMASGEILVESGYGKETERSK
ncbi:MAG: dihydroorotase family protein [Chloroflexota bacterium]|nr:dihydroorotase family protein [Chloroflexota bacterium]